MSVKIVCAGTFDRLHTGHIEYLKNAKSLIDEAELIVIVARNENSNRIKDKAPKNDEKIRLHNIRSLDFVDKAVLGYGKSRVINRVVSLKPDIFALGYDQWANEDWLKKELANRGLDVKVIRMPKFKSKYLQG